MWYCIGIGLCVGFVAGVIATNVVLFALVALCYAAAGRTDEGTEIGY